MNFKALCFVDMPFGQKPDLKSGVVVDFDQIYNEAIKPAIEDLTKEDAAGLTPGYSEGSFFNGDAARSVLSLDTCSRVVSFIHSSGAAAKASSSRC